MAGPNRITQAERNDRELNADINAAIAGTEREIFDEALGDDSLEMDGDNSLEEMGDGLEGDQVDDEEADEEVDAELPAQDQGQQRQRQTTVEEPEVEEHAVEEPPQDQRGRPQEREQGVPTAALREERERRRAAEAERNAVLERVRMLEQRLDTTLTQIATQPKPQQTEEKKPAPVENPHDQFAEPAEWVKWERAQAKETARAEAERVIQTVRQERFAENEQRVNANMNRAARGERGAEFVAGHQLLMQTLQSLGPNDPRGRAFAEQIMSSPDPAAEVLEWFEQNGAAEWREQDRQRREEWFLQQAEDLGFQVQDAPQRGNGRGRQRQEPQHEVRLPSSLRRQPPSLNAAAGGGRQQIQDPEMLDDSEESIFRFATNR